MESLPLGVHATSAIAVALDAVMGIGRAIRTSQYGARAGIATGNLSYVGQRFDGRLQRILGHPGSALVIVTVLAAAKDPAVTLAARLVGTCGGDQQQDHGQSKQDATWQCPWNEG